MLEFPESITRVLESIADSFLVVDGNWRLTYMNPAARRIFTDQGLKVEELIGKHFWNEAFPETRGTLIEQEYRRSMTERVSGEFDYYLRAWQRWFAIRVYPVEAGGISIYFHDITKRKLTEERATFLASLSKKLASVTEEEQIIRITVEAVGRHLNADRCYFVECLEHENRILIGHNWHRSTSSSIEGAMSLFDFGGIDWWHQYSQGDFAVEDVETEPLTREKAANYVTVGVRSYAVQPCRREGEWTVVLGVTESFPRKWTADELSLMDDVIARVWPLVERARADQALRKSEARFRAIVSQATTGVVQADAEGQMTLVNRRWCEMLGYTEAELLTMNIAEVTEGESLRATLSAVHRLAEGGPSFDMEKRYKRKDGSTFWASSSVNAVRGPAGEYQGLVAVVLDISERKRAEERERRAATDALEAAKVNANFRTLFEQGTYFAGVMSLDGTVVEANRIALVACGFKKEEVIGKKFWDCGWWNRSPALMEMVRKASQQAAEGNIFRQESPYFVADGSQRFVDLSIAPAKDDSGQVVFLIPTGTDITERKRAEEALRESEERYRTLFESMDEGFCIIEVIFDAGQRPMDYRFLEINPAFEKQTGFKDAKGRRMREMAPEHEQNWFETFGNVALTGQPARFESQATALGRWFEVHAFSVEMPERHRVGVVFSDITERRRVVEAVREVGERYQTLFNSIDEGFCVIEVHFDDRNRAQDYRFLETNPAFAKQTGIKAAEGRWMREIAPEHEEHWYEIYGKVSSSGESVRFENRAGALNRWFDVFAFRIGEPEQRKVAILFTDISERKKAEIALKEAQMALARQNEFLDQTVQQRTAKLQETIMELEAFSYSISHDMRSPLRAMQGYAEALLQDYQSNLDDQAKHYLERIHRSAARLDLLVRDVLAYSKVAKGDMQMKTINLEHLIGDIVQNYPNLHSSRIQVTASPFPPVIGHEGLLTQIVSNLLGNAVKFSYPGQLPEVAISAETMGPDVRIWFADKGIGIAPEHHEQIFHIFGRVYPDKKYEGTGIGLAIVRKAAERMGGSAGVVSELGKGSQFWITLKRSA
ncbi:PAS domain S-box protein [Pedosphaera parvula]|uniref:histidine kinase n=1 Tax=Pedosphaera parvula (strain Ellin514) TaxID=320771 RepID=B9XCE6_PEDPL|nr:PAS domain S-box protein [Pedosphaera parvula]EEF62614.1 multi-sensor signal transduction histidine kinase [Pedosphaera parvula Ellin514]